VGVGGWWVGWLADWIVAGVTVTRVLKQHLAVARKLFSTSICCVAKPQRQQRQQQQPPQTSLTG